MNIRKKFILLDYWCFIIDKGVSLLSNCYLWKTYMYIIKYVYILLKNWLPNGRNIL